MFRNTVIPRIAPKKEAHTDGKKRLEPARGRGLRKTVKILFIPGSLFPDARGAGVGSAGGRGRAAPSKIADTERSEIQPCSLVPPSSEERQKRGEDDERGWGGVPAERRAKKDAIPDVRAPLPRRGKRSGGERGEGNFRSARGFSFRENFSRARASHFTRFLTARERQDEKSWRARAIGDK